MFVRTDNFEILNGSSLIGYVNIAPAKLLDIFGEPEDGDDCKVSGEYVFALEDDPDFGFTLYDWKSTSLYDGGDPTPEDFWASEYPYEFHIGGKSSKLLADFRAFILENC